jgi:serine/threonine-protein kinase
METYCTRPNCSRPTNHFADLDDSNTLKTVQQKFCMNCGMPQILVGRYLPTRLLGKGGFGAAFLAIDRYTPAMRQCVVKLFQPAGDLSENQLKVAQELFEREAEVLEKLGNRHPQIPNLLAFFELSVPSPNSNKPEQFFYLVQEFIDGKNLEEELEEKGTLTQSEMLEVLVEILKVLQFVHDNGSIHRDIKPSNIMRDRNGKLFLLDFGAVKQVTTGGGQAAQSSTGIYSMGFAPPEQMAGNVVYPATDLYALGVTCITLLTGKQPSELYDAYSNTWKWRSMVSVHQRLGNVLDKMLKASASERFTSATETLQALASQAPTPRSPQPVQPSPQPTTPLASPGNAPTTSPPLTPPIAQPATPAPMQATAAGQASVPSSSPSSKGSFSTLEFLTGAAFTGFEGGLLAIALASLAGTTLISTGFWLVLVIVLVLCQARRVIEKMDLAIIAIVSAAVVLLAAPLRSHGLVLQIAAAFGNPLVAVLAIAVFIGLLSIAVATLFRLVYKILSTLL